MAPFKLIICFLTFLASQFFGAALARDNVNCGISVGQPLTNAYGPYDATNPSHADKLPIVLGAHFTRDVEMLLKGNRGSIISDIDYTLRAIPNYHRALAAMAKYQRLHKDTSVESDEYYSAECYFRRAIYFQPADVVSRMLFGSHLHLIKQYSAAEKMYLSALALNPKYAELQYNAGLLYVDMKQIDKAVEHARIAYNLGYPLKGLKLKIERSGGRID